MGLEASRRGVLRGTLGVAAVPASGAAPAADEFDTLRLRWRDQLLGAGFDPAAEPFATRLAELGELARRHRGGMTPASTTALWPDLPIATSASITRSYARLYEMAQAFAQPGTGSTGDAALADAAVTGLDWLYTKVYNERTTRYGNWWDWQIGSPQLLLDAGGVLHERLDAPRRASYLRAIDHFVPDSAVANYTGTSTGANRVDLCRVLALRGVLGKQAAKLALARDALTPVFPYVTSGDGLYRDGSFIQHTWLPYTGTYGLVLISGLARLFALLNGSSWAVTNAGRQNILDAVERCFAPWIFNGLMMDGVSGRGISRGIATLDPKGVQHDDHLRGHPFVPAILRLAGTASAAEAARWRGIVKGWMQRDYYRPYLANPALGVAEVALGKSVLDDAAVTPRGEPVGHRLFAAMDRAVHRRPGWAATVSMCSARIAHYEHGNGENLRGWHTSAGMLYHWGATSGNGQYSDAFWPTVDPYRLPGVTVSRKALADGAGGAWGADKPAATWVGGTTDGEFAALGQYVNGFQSTLRAKKSWICLDDAIVCLGAGITARDGAGVESIVDNRNLGATGTHALTVNGVAQPSALGWSASLPGVRWAHLAGFGGYVFLGSPTLRAARTARTGAWRDINTNGAATAITRRYVTLWYDHGTDPTNGAYAYLVLPAASPSVTSARAADTAWLSVLANTDAQQGIAVPSRGVSAVSFWLAGTVGPLTVDQPASVLVRETAGRATLCLADPKRAASTVELTWTRAVTSVLSKDPSITVLQTAPHLRIRATVAGTAGAPHRLTVTL